MKYSPLILAVFIPSSANAQGKDSEFCSSHTTTACHSSSCDLFVHDSQRVKEVTIPHKPAYHTYSRWELAGKTFIFAYRDVEYQPSGMVADIYLASGTAYVLIGKIKGIGDIVSDVATAD
jgi:hypothetical protein